MNLTGCGVFSGGANFASNPNLRGGLKIISAENAYGIVRLKFWRGCRILQCGGQVKTLHARAVIRWIEPDDLCIFASGLRKQVGVGTDQVSDFHAVSEGISAGTKYMPLQVDSALVIRGNRENMNL